MQQEAQVEPVAPAAMREAVLSLAGGQRRDVSAELRAEGYERMIEQAGGRHRFWWARRGGRCVAACLIVPSPGRVGIVFHSPSQAPGVDGGCLAAVVRESSREALDDGLSFVQSLVAPGRGGDVAALTAAGFERLAELIYMRLDLAAAVPAADDEGWLWRDCRPFDAAELAATITGTYEDSLDCPALCGLRELSDVLASHRASGVFNPETWWIAYISGRAAGCVLVNDSGTGAEDMDLVYMGVVRHFRGRGLGRAMVRRAAGWARRNRRSALTVAVDASNVYAKAIYDRQGFRQTVRRLAYMRSARSRAAHRP
jgi:ribosomal protein S18 acetylase RimI-like enzyme